MDEEGTGRYFGDAVSNALDITDRYLALGDLPTLAGVSDENDHAVVDAIRNLLESDGGGFVSVSKLAAQGRTQAESLYRENRIAAVDGTDAISPLAFVSDTLYASAVVVVRPRSPGVAQVKVTRTHASSFVAEQVQSGRQGSWSDTLKAWASYLQGARDHELSWVNTFREYQERDVVQSLLDGDLDTYVLVDGPVITQNMLTQKTTQDLLGQILASGRAIGFIKNLAANPLLVAIGRALRSGEAFILRDWKHILSERFRVRQEAIAAWIDRQPDTLIRVVYKRRRKAYCVECSDSALPLAFGILEHDGSGPAEHDIPMLLALADSHVRSQFRGAEARDQVLARAAIGDLDRFLDLTHERNLR